MSERNQKHEMELKDWKDCKDMRKDCEKRVERQRCHQNMKSPSREINGMRYLRCKKNAAQCSSIKSVSDNNENFSLIN